MIQVAKYRADIARQHGETVAFKFFELMVKWDGSSSVIGSFYDKGVLDDRLQEALETP